MQLRAGNSNAQGDEIGGGDSGTKRTTIFIWDLLEREKNQKVYLAGRFGGEGKTGWGDYCVWFFEDP